MCQIYTVYCIWSVISSISNLNRESSSLGLFYHVPLKRDQRDCDWRLGLNDTPNAIGCIYVQDVYVQYIFTIYMLIYSLLTSGLATRMPLRSADSLAHIEKLCTHFKKQNQYIIFLKRDLRRECRCAVRTLLHICSLLHVECHLISHIYLLHIYSLLHVECHLISISTLNLIGLFSTERGKRDREN